MSATSEDNKEKNIEKGAASDHVNIDEIKRNLHTYI
jgi:hypothetical protein